MVTIKNKSVMRGGNNDFEDGNEFDRENSNADNINDAIKRLMVLRIIRLKSPPRSTNNNNKSDIKAYS